MQASSDVPVALSRHAGGGIVAPQTFTPDVQDNQPQIFQPPTPPYEVVGSGYQTLQVDIPPSYEEAVHDKCDTYV